MINGKSILAIIPARGGSKAVPRKNIRLVGNKPLIAWTIEEAKKSKYIDRLILSSEDKEIIQVAKDWGCEVPFIRPAHLSEDSTPGMEPVLHALSALPDYDFVILLQPTSPLRRAEDMDGCIEECVRKKAKTCVSLVKVDKSPYWMYSVFPDGHMQPVMPPVSEKMQRQDLPVTYTINGAVYVAECKWLLKIKTFIGLETIAYLMPKERSLDIDDEIDMRLFKAWITERTHS